MRTFWWVGGQLTEVQRFINVPMRWCEQYPARERRELWITTSEGSDVKLVIHSRLMPARRGHHVVALLLGEQLVGIVNATTGKQLNCIRSDPPLLWRRCDAAAIVALVVGAATASMLTAWPWLMIGLPAALLYVPGTLAVRFAWRCRIRAQVDRAIEIVARPIVRHSHLRRVK